MFLAKRVRCFNCDTRIKNAEEAFSIKLNTLEGPHEVKMCFDCAQDFDKIAAELEEVINERNQSI